MDLNIIMWVSGMFFTLGIFALKVGFGLGLGGIRLKWILITLSLYMTLFIIIAYFSKGLVKYLEPVLRGGQYIHVLMAAGLILWGIILLRKQGSNSIQKLKIQDSGFKTEQTVLKNKNSSFSPTSPPPSLLLLLPCPVCLSAMTFSVWSALSVISQPPYLIGLGLGSLFSVLSLGFVFLTRFLSQNSSLRQESFLGLSMTGIGLYFISSLFVPSKIEEAKGVYQSFVRDSFNISLNHSIGAFALLFVAFFIGYFLNSSNGSKSSNRSHCIGLKSEVKK